MDDTVEDKLLIGDRPKPHPGLEIGDATLNERLAKREESELNDVRRSASIIDIDVDLLLLIQLTPAERALVQFVDSLTEWLGPWHDFLRPPPSVVLAEAAKMTEQKTGGQQIKSLILPPNANGSANGHSKKDEEAPPVKEGPELAVSFFDGWLSNHCAEGLCAK